MDQLAVVLSEAVKAKQAPFLVGALGTSKAVCWTGSAGEEVAGLPLNQKTVFRIVSMSKAVGATAAVILAERGKLDWDTPVEEILPEFGNLQVLTSEKDGQYQLRPPRTKATLRELATHTSGLVYGFWDANIARYLESAGLPPVISGLRASLTCPLAFDPGEKWHYGSGVDWLGLAIEAIDGRSIDRFCHEEIFTPLGMVDTHFELEDSIAARLAPVFGRSPEGDLVEAPIKADPPSHPEFYGIGHALYSTAHDYMHFLRMWLNQGQLDGVRILKPESIWYVLENHIGDLRMQPLSTALPIAVEDLTVFPDIAKSHSLCFARTEEDMPGMRSAGSQFWGGVLNTHFWFDPTRDLAGILMTQLVPFLDGRFMSTFAAFEQKAYTQAIGICL